MRLNPIFLLIPFLAIIGCSNNPKVELVLDAQCGLGEGAIWNYETNRLYWVNITGKMLNIYNPETGENNGLVTGQMIGTVVPSESGKAIVALQNGIYQMDVTTGSKQLIVNPEEGIAGNRFNDGKCDPAGRFWAGTLSLGGEKGKGALYRIDGDGAATKMVGDVTCSNGIVWSADKTKMYYIDTPTHKVMAYDYNNETGEIGNPAVAVEIPEEMGVPDGMSIDSDGNLWIALWGGFAISCWNPQNGKLIRKINVPAKNVTSCAFGGDRLETLYITTARQDLNPEELEKFPLSGGLFKVQPGVRGVKASFFKGQF